jgi:hypothetical protein
MSCYKRLFSGILFFIALSNVSAESYIREYTYQASELDSKITSRDSALKQLKRELIEYIGVHIQSEITMSTNSDGYVFFNEDIQALSAGVTRLEVIDEKWNGKEFYVKASVNVDASSLLGEFKLIQNDIDKHSLGGIENPEKSLCYKKFTLDSAESIYSKALEEERDKERSNAVYESSLKNLSYSAAQKVHAENRSSIQEFDKTIRSYKRCAAYYGYPQAQLDMWFSSDAYVSTYDLLNKNKWLASAAKNEHAAAMYWFAKTIYRGFNHRLDIKTKHKKYFWLYKSAMNGYTNAMYEIGRSYYNGDYYEKNLTEAERWLLLAINTTSSEYFFEKEISIHLLQEIQRVKLQ